MLVPAGSTPGKTFWARYPGLVWSNPDAEDSAYICAELLAPHFSTILAIAIEFGLDRLRKEWQQMLENGEARKLQRTKPLVERILKNIEEGFRDASTRN